MMQLSPEQIAAMATRMTDDEVVTLAEALLVLDKEKQRSSFQNLFPDEGQYRRELYPKHLEFFRAGATHRERLLLAANRFGKTLAAGQEASFHLTGRYPDWWEGRRFETSIDAWVAGDTNETTRDIIQKTLLGEVAWENGKKGCDGVGLIPHDAHGSVRWKTGVPDLIDYIEIKHESGRNSRLAFKSYDQGRRVFQGTAKHLIWLDEECPMDVYGECLIRTATTNGILMLTFTPLLGMSELVRSFLKPDTGEVSDGSGQ
jgi:phage terminase large subunit-like protein